jgi:formate dehydrogenase major subunit
VTPSNGPSEWQEDYAEVTARSRRIATDEAMEPAE